MAAAAEPMPGFRNHKTVRRILLVAFGAALGLTSFFAVRLTAHAVYWTLHRDEPIEDWMTVGYVAHAYGISQRDLYIALGLPVAQPDRRSLRTIAAAENMTIEQVRAKLMAAITASRGQPPEPAATKP